MKTKYLDNEIELLNAIKRNEELSDYGKEKLIEFNDIKKALTIPIVTQRSELLLFADYSESDKVSQTTDECVDNYLDQKQ